MSIQEKLRNFDINDLDVFERRQYDHFIKQSSKEQVLQILINNVEGDYTQLSPQLSKIAEKYETKFGGGGGVNASENKYVYKWYEERGHLTASVESIPDGNYVWEYDSEDYEEFGSPVEDGFMQHWEDIAGLENYLKDMKVITNNAEILSEVDSQKRYDYYATGGNIKAHYIREDDWHRRLYKDSNGTIYADVDGVLHYITKDAGEPISPAHNVEKVDPINELSDAEKFQNMIKDRDRQTADYKRRMKIQYPDLDFGKGGLLNDNEAQRIGAITEFAIFNQKDRSLHHLLEKKFGGETISTGGGFYVTLFRISKDKVFGVNNEYIVLYTAENGEGMGDVDIFEDEYAIENSITFVDFSDRYVGHGEGDILIKDEGEFYVVHGQTEKGLAWLTKNGFTDKQSITDKQANQLMMNMPHPAIKFEEFKHGGTTESKKIAVKKIVLKTTDGKVFGEADSFEKADEIIFFAWKRKYYSDVEYFIEWMNGETLEGSIDLEPTDFHAPHKHNILTWHLKTFWNNVANASSKGGLTQSDIDEAKRLVSNYSLYSKGGTIESIGTFLSKKVTLGDFLK